MRIVRTIAVVAVVLASVFTIANASDDARFDRRTSKDEKAYFVMKAANGEIIGTSEQYSSASAMENGVQSVKKNARTAAVDDLS